MPNRDVDAHGDDAPSRDSKSATRMWVWPIMFVQYFALGLLRPEMPGILLELFSGKMNSVALYQGATDCIGAFCAFALVPWIGSFSDQRGRKPALLLSALAAAGPVFVMTLYGSVLGQWPTLGLYALVALFSKVNSYSVALSYVADCSSQSQRSSVFAEVSGVMFLGLTGGPFCSSYLSRTASLLTATILNVAAAVYIVLLLPETRKMEDKGKGKSSAAGGKDEEKANVADEKKGLLAGEKKGYGAASSSSGSVNSSSSSSDKPANKHGGMLMAYSFLTQNQFYLLIGVITLLAQFAVFGVGQIYFLYLTEELAFTRADLIRAAWIGGVETSVIMLAIMPFASLGLFVSTQAQAYGLITFWSISGIAFPNTCSLLSTYTSSAVSGLAQGALSAVKCAASGLGPALFALIFSEMVTLKHKEMNTSDKVTFADDHAYLIDIFGIQMHYTALPFVIGAGFIAAACALTLYLPSTNDKQGEYPKAEVAGKEQKSNAQQQQKSSSSSSSNPKDVVLNVISTLQHTSLRNRFHHGIQGVHTYFDEWQHNYEHLRARRQHDGDEAKEREAALLKKKAQEEARLSGQEQAAKTDKTYAAVAASKSDSTDDDDFVLPTPRSTRSRLVWVTLSCVIVLVSLAGVNLVGHMLTPTETPSGSAAKSDTPSAKALLIDDAMASMQIAQMELVEKQGKKDRDQDDEEHSEKKAHMKPMIVMSLMGPRQLRTWSGVGKSALSRHLNAAYGLTALSSGVLVRSEITRGTELGKQIKSTVENGGLIADEVVMKLVEMEMKRIQSNESLKTTGFILDGFPRTLVQARMLDAADSPIPPINPMIYIHMRDDILAQRREGRRICPVCGKTYNMHAINQDGYHLRARVPQHSNQTTCDVENAVLVRRQDDLPEIAEKRMKAFYNESLPMAPYYSSLDRLIDIEKKESAGKLFKIMKKEIEKHLKTQEKEAKEWEERQRKVEKEKKKEKKDGEDGRQQRQNQTQSENEKEEQEDDA